MFLSLDLETTGIGDKRQILEICCIMDDLQRPIDECPVFHYIVLPEGPMVCDLKALTMNAKLLEMIDFAIDHPDAEPGTLLPDQRPLLPCIAAGELAFRLREWTHAQYQSLTGQPVTDKCLFLLGKNAGTFDLEFLKAAGVNTDIYHHRIMDIGSLCWHPEDMAKVPSLATVLPRLQRLFPDAGFRLPAHTAFADAYNCLLCLRLQMRDTPTVRVFPQHDTLDFTLMPGRSVTVYSECEHPIRINSYPQSGTATSNYAIDPGGELKFKNDTLLSTVEVRVIQRDADTLTVWKTDRPGIFKLHSGQLVKIDGDYIINKANGRQVRINALDGDPNPVTITTASIVTQITGETGTQIGSVEMEAERGYDIDEVFWLTNSPDWVMCRDRFWRVEEGEIWLNDRRVRAKIERPATPIVIQGIDDDDITHIVDYETGFTVPVSREGGFGLTRAGYQNEFTLAGQEFARVFQNRGVISESGVAGNGETMRIVENRSDSVAKVQVGWYIYTVRVAIKPQKIAAQVSVYRTTTPGIVKLMNGQFAAINQADEIQIGDLRVPVTVLDPEQPIDVVQTRGVDVGMDQNAVAEVVHEVSRSEGQNANFARIYGDPEHSDLDHDGREGIPVSQGGDYEGPEVALVDGQAEESDF